MMSPLEATLAAIRMDSPLRLVGIPLLDSGHPITRSYYTLWDYLRDARLLQAIVVMLRIFVLKFLRMLFEFDEVLFFPFMKIIQIASCFIRFR